MKKILLILVAVIGFGINANAISARVTGTEKRGSGWTYIKYDINPEGKSGWFGIKITWTDTSGKTQVYEKKSMAGSTTASNKYEYGGEFGVQNYCCNAKVEIWWSN